MDALLTDLDALVLTVRNPLARTYIDESIRAYRAGSYKASIVSIWVAVTFDILAKIRELSDMGDGAAGAYVGTFDLNVENNNTPKLLEIEAGLLDAAEKQFNFLDPISRRHFERMQSDRHLCAHPAFTMDGQLFTPEPELVRLYLIEAIRNLLSQRPVQGKTILDQFDQDFRSNSFPTNIEQIARFTQNRYLQASRPNVRSSLAIVIAKALLKQSPPGWEAKLSLLPAVLRALKEHDAGVWANTILPTVTSLIEAADDQHLPYAYGLLVSFDDVRHGITQAANAKLRALLENLDPTEADVPIFAAGALPEFTAIATAKFEASERAVQGAIVARYPLVAYWPSAVATLEDSGSYRNAESNFTILIEPFAPVATPQQLKQVLAAVAANGQVWHAADIPSQLAAFADAVQQRNQLELEQLADFLAFLDEHNRRDRFADTLQIFENAGVAIPEREIIPE